MLIYEVDANFLAEYGDFYDFSYEALEAIVDFFNETDSDTNTKFDRSIAWCFHEYDSKEDWYIETVQSLEKLADEIKEDFVGCELTRVELNKEIEKRVESALNNVTWYRELSNGNILIFENC